MSHVSGTQRSPLLDDWFNLQGQPGTQDQPFEPGLGMPVTTPTMPGVGGDSCDCFNTQALAPEVAEAVEQFLDANPMMDSSPGVDPMLEEQLRTMMQGLKQSELQQIPGMGDLNTEAIEDKDIANMDASELLAMIVEFLKDNPSVLDHAQQQQQPTMPARGFQSSQPTSWPSQGGGGSGGGGGTSASGGGHNHGGGAPSGGGRSSSPVNAGTPSLPAGAGPVNAVPGQNGVPGGLQANAARGAAHVRALGFEGTIGGLGERANKSDHPDGNAIDIMTYDDKELGQEMANYFIDNHEALGVKYVIFNQTIWSDKGGWQPRPMEDRGGPTANHLDHPHISFHGGGLA